MKQMLIYCMTLLAFVLPAVFFVMSRDEHAPQIKTGQEDREPPLFKWTAVFAMFLNQIGLGSLCRKIFAKHAEKLDGQLKQTGLAFDAGRVYCTQIFLLLIMAAVASGVTSMLVDKDEKASIAVAGLIAALIGWATPGTVIGNLAQERQTKILQALPYSIDLIASAMRGGLDFGAAIRFYVKLNISGPLTDEYAQMLREMELGVIRIAALQNMAERVKIKEFTSFVSAVALGTELGAPLTDTMEIQGQEMRKARFSIAECKAQRAPSLMLIPMALFILPAVFIIILTPVFLKMREAGVPLF